MFAGFTVKVPKKRVLTPDKTTLEAFKQKYDTISEEEHARILGLAQHHNDAAQTTNEKWLAARKNRVTGSTVAAIVRENPYEARLAFLAKKLWPKEMDARGKKACAHGNMNEPIAEAAFQSYMDVQVGELKNSNGDVLDGVGVHNLGLYVCKKPGYGMLGMSPDGLLETTWKRGDGSTYSVNELIEYKCPISWKNLVARDDGHMYKMENLPPPRHPEFIGENEQAEVPGSLARKWMPVPKYYFTQCQYGMEIFRLSGIDLPRCHFVVWSPSRAVEDVFVQPSEHVLKAGTPYMGGTIQHDVPAGETAAKVVYRGRTEVTVIERDLAYGKFLVEEAVRFWEELYAPRYILKETGELEEGEVDVTVEI